MKVRGQRIYYLVPSLIFLISGCGGGGAVIPAAGSAGTGTAKMIVVHSKSANPREECGVVKTYRVTVSGAGIDEPVVKEFSGEAENGTVEGIPSGGGRTVLVEAINPSGRLIREGALEGVVVEPGGLAEVTVEMDAVPIFANLEDGNAIANNRLKFVLFADPEDPLEVREKSGAASSVVCDLAACEDEFYPDAASGLVTMVPGSVSPGEHTFEVVSKRTGKSSTITIKIMDGSKIGPAPLFGGGRAGSSAISRIGYGPPSLGPVLTEY